MRFAAPIAALSVAALGGAVAESAPSPPPTVACDKIIDYTRFPYVGNRDPQHRYRLVLGVVSVPPAYLEQVVRTHERPWAYWRKAGLVVRGDRAPLTVTVPEEWRNRAAIEWGNTGIVSSLRIKGCGSQPDVGHAYAGGFHLRSPSACVPLIFRAGSRTATVRFGIGRTCGPR